MRRPGVSFPLLRTRVVLVSLLTVYGLALSQDLMVIDYQMVNISVRQESGQLIFEFLEGGPPSESAKKVPVGVYYISVYIRGGAPVLWQVESSYAGPTVTSATYGVLPEGFIQKVPENGSVRLLEKNQAYTISAHSFVGWGRADFVYQGE